MIEPKLRFKADDGSQFPDWEEKTLGDIGTAKMCKRVLKEQTSEKGDVPFYKIGTFGGTPDAFISRELYEELKTKYSFPRKGNILLSAAGTIGRTVVYDGQDAFFQDSNIVWLDHDDSVLDGFLLQFYNKTSWNNLEGGTIKRLYNGLFLSKVIHVPSIPEQQKIVEFLSTIDTVIEKQKETVATWEERKKGVMQKLFSQEVRFKADDGSEFPEWEEKKLNEIAVRVTRKNKNNVTDIPLTISSADGLIDQRNFFNKVVASKDMSGYFLLKNGEFAYNKSYSKGYDFGSIKRLDLYDEGALSTLYICFALNKNENSDFYQKYFDSLSWYPELQKICAEGARNHGLLNVPTNDCFQLKLCVPSSDKEQQKIADCLSSLDEVIEKQKATLAAWEELKKGLLQQMFV